jgi:hypothetical protein
MTDGIVTYAAINAVTLAIIGFFVRRLVNGNDKKHSQQMKQTENLQEKQTKLELEIKVMLATIQGQITQALASGNKVDALEKTVWALDSRIAAAWKVLDQKRISDL